MLTKRFIGCLAYEPQERPAFKDIVISFIPLLDPNFPIEFKKLNKTEISGEALRASGAGYGKLLTGGDTEKQWFEFDWSTTHILEAVIHFSPELRNIRWNSLSLRECALLQFMLDARELRNIRQELERTNNELRDTKNKVDDLQRNLGKIKHNYQAIFKYHVLC